MFILGGVKNASLLGFLMKNYLFLGENPLQVTKIVDSKFTHFSPDFLSHRLFCLTSCFDSGCLSHPVRLFSPLLGVPLFAPQLF